PSVFEDIVAMVALYRPGPMQFIDDFIARKRGEKPITYFHDAMENALKNTYGVLVYQEQVMQISKEVCGFTGGEADTLRKAIGKKKIDMMRKMKARMIEGAQEVSGIDAATMERFWKQLEDFAAYCFNKSHAACYGLIAYQTAYLKAHYPAAYMAALMTSDFDDTDRLAIEITECQHMGIQVLLPDVNESFVEFAVVKSPKGVTSPLAPVRFGMAAIKNVGTGAVEEILRARAEAPFESLEDFLSRVSCRIVNRKALESLIKTGAFDRFGDRMVLLHNIDLMLAYAQRLQKQQSSGQTDIFGNSVEEHLKPVLTLETAGVSHDQHEQLLWERELLGLYLSKHPLDLFENILSEQTMPLKELKGEHDGKPVTVGGAIIDIREIVTKNGQKMAFVKLEDRSGEAEAILFPSSYQQTLGVWVRDKVVLIRGRVNGKDREGRLSDEAKIMVDDAREITVAQAEAYQPTGKKKKVPKASPKAKQAAAAAQPSVTAPAKVYIRLSSSNDEQTLVTLKQTLDSYRGDTDVVLVLGEADKKQAIKLPDGINKDSEGLEVLRELVGTDNLVVR
ncbi:MAG TPA: DNA polymerase III subunit alpha, partial [Candidatus Saccharimonadales bacterium]|nr:DNA polymerase III subunit alpha [Candidatus Saccharimonadales bacterium]